MKKTPTTARWLVAPLFLLLFGSCKPESSYPVDVDGWAPVYVSNEENTINATDARTTEHGGKIYVKGPTLYQVEAGKGIHVIDISDPNNAKKIKFINCVGAQELSIKDNYLYTNNINDLVVLDISDISNVKVANRKTGSLHMVDATAPPGTGYFECPEASKGVVIGWEQKNIKNPKCRK